MDELYDYIQSTINECVEENSDVNEDGLKTGNVNSIVEEIIEGIMVDLSGHLYSIVELMLDESE